jgi:hypothetical protein
VGSQRSRLTFFFDRNLGDRVPGRLVRLGWPIEKHDDHFSFEITDIELLPEVAKRGWVFVTQDKMIHRRPAEKQALLESGLRTFLIVSTANLSANETIEVLERARQEMFFIALSETGPFLYGIRKDGTLSPVKL